MKNKDLYFNLKGGFCRIQRRAQQLEKLSAEAREKRQQLETAALTAEETAAELERLHSQAEKRRDGLAWDLEKLREKKFKKELQLKTLNGK